MCGIAGATRNLLAESPQHILDRMNEVMKHRGPDMGEIYFDDGMGLCHRRLSIIDLSADGKQPMHSGDGRYTIVFNGEIYNYLPLRKELEEKGYIFHSKTDTEVLLNAYIEFGPASLEKIRGMYAYAIWDSKQKRLFAARDRIGKKPLYYYFCEGKFAFASEIKSILAIEAVRPELETTALIDYLKYLFIPHPKSIYKNIFKLPPGHYLLYSEGQLQTREYWDVDFSQQSRLKEEELADELLEIIEEATRCRLLSDVPLGAFLSGGIDSSAVVALMGKASSNPVTTCTIGFKDKAFNEAEYAKEFARSLGARHYEHYVQDEPAQIIRKLVWHFDEPFADSSMVPTYYVSRMARQNVTVALSGDGGDESFAGYEKYCIDKLENTVRQFTPSFLLHGLSLFSGLFPGSTVLKKTHSLCSSALLTPAQGFYVTNSFITDPQMTALLNPDLQKMTAGYSPSDHLKYYYERANGADHLAKILYTDLKLLLPGAFLVKVDRMSMANALEVRSPLLDHKLIECAATIPSHLKLHGNQKKYILKKSFAEILPERILTRKKHGFESPVNRWFRQELQEMAEKSLFENPSLENFLNIAAINELWNEHQSRKFNHGTLLWTIFIFSLWLEEFRN